MKKNICKLLVVSFLLVIVFFTGCKKNDDNENSFTFERKAYKIGLCAIDFNGEVAQDTFEYKLLVSTKGLKFDEATGDYEGNANEIKVSLVSTDGENIKPGIYTFDPLSSKDDYTGFNAKASIMEPAHDSINYINSVKSGIVKLQRAGNKFKIDFEFFVTKFDYETLLPEVPEKQYQIKGYYEGSVQMHDLTVE